MFSVALCASLFEHAKRLVTRVLRYNEKVELAIPQEATR